MSTTVAPTFATTLSGVDQTVGYQLPMTVVDSTASGAGWRLAITSTQFATADATPRTLPATASRVTAATATCAAGPCTDPVTDIALPVTVPAAAVAPAPVAFFNAQAGSGLGEFTITAQLATDVPANAYAGTYTSTITLAITSGP